MVTGSGPGVDLKQRAASVLLVQSFFVYICVWMDMARKQLHIGTRREALYDLVGQGTVSGGGQGGGGSHRNGDIQVVTTNRGLINAIMSA